jgi:hypothetical protein
VDADIKKVIEHEATCATCKAANKRINDFCIEGQLLFAEYQKTHQPTSIIDATVTDEQYERLLEEARRKRKSGSN